MSTLSAADIEINRGRIEPFFETHCFDCHGATEQKGDLRLDNIHWSISNNEEAQHWQDILDVLNLEEMPPRKRPQPKPSEMKLVIGSLTSDLTSARKRLAETGGVYTMRRINKREYIGSIKHLFGIQIDAFILPDDITSTEQYDTSEKLQYFDSALLEQYTKVGKRVALEGLKWSAAPYAKPSKRRQNVGPPRRAKPSVLPRGDQGTYINICDRRSRGVGIEHGKDPRASYKLNIHGGVHDVKTPKRHYVSIRESSPVRGQAMGIQGVVKILGTVEEPETVSITLPARALSAVQNPSVGISEPLPENMSSAGKWRPIYLRRIGTGAIPNVWIDWLELEGPFYDQPENFFGNLINPEGLNLGRPEKAEELLRRFCFEAFRRIRPSERYLDKLLAYYNQLMAEGVGYKQAMAETLGIVLSSPSFLYLEEGRVGGGDSHLDARSFASRLAYFLWSAPPDEELYKLAENGELLKPKILHQQVTRMAKDTKADSFFEGFMDQWSKLDRLNIVSVDWHRFPLHNGAVRFSTSKEPSQFFKVLVQENLPINNLIDSDFIVGDSHLAHFYGIEGDYSHNDFRKIPLPAGSPRGGLITQASFLTIGSTGERSSPVIRGALILEKLLNNPPPPPPPNVPELGSPIENPVSNRELVDAHRSQSACASCHDKIDPIGYGLENFDSIGLWRDVETVGKKRLPIETSAELISGTTFENLDELKQLLKSQEHRLVRHVIDSLLAYAIGRDVEFSEEEDLQKALQHAKSRGYLMSDLLTIVVNSKTFRNK